MTTISRRTFLAASGIGAATLVTGLGTQIALGQVGSTNDKLLVIHLRGGADGLSMTPPYGDSSYYDARPRIAIPRPGENGGALPLTSASSNGTAAFPTGLDGVVGLHPALAPLESLWTKGQLAVVIGTGLPNATRSHFSAERYVNTGGAKGSIAQGGWVGRTADSLPSDGPITSASARGSGGLVAGSNNTAELMERLNRFGLRSYRNRGRHAKNTLAQTALAGMYAGSDSVQQSGSKALELMDRVSDLDLDRSAVYPNNNIYAGALRETATLFDSDLNIRAASIRRGKWDHHSNLPGRFTEDAEQLASGLRAFADDTGLQGITVVVVTEFGRTVNENSGQGTDHGLGSTALVMGAGIRGGVFGDDYPEAVGGGNRPELPVLTDYRKMLSEVVSERAGLSDLGRIFPDYRQNGVLGLTR